MKDYYEILGVDDDATTDQIKDAHRRASIKAHPDRGGTAERQADVNEAFEVLSDPEKRKRYDAGEDPTPGGNQIEAEVLAVMGAAFSQTQKDPITFVTDAIDQQRTDIKAAAATIRDKIKKFKDNLRKFTDSRDRDDNPSSYDSIIEAVEANVASAEHDLATHEAAAARCDDKLAYFNGLTRAGCDGAGWVTIKANTGSIYWGG